MHTSKNISHLQAIFLTLMLSCTISAYADWVTTDFNVFNKRMSQELKNKSDIQISYNFTQVSEENVNQNIQFYQAQLFYDEELKMVVNAFDFSVNIEKLLNFKRPTTEQIAEFIKNGGCFFKVGGKYKNVTVKRGQRREIVCNNCHGKGRIRKFRMNGGDEERVCPVCHGKGKVANGREPDKKKIVLDRLQFNVYSIEPTFDSLAHKKCLLSMYIGKDYPPQQSVDEEETGDDFSFTKEDATQQSKDIKSVILSKNISLELVKVVHGSFIMGSPNNESERKNNETQHRVTLTEDFWIGKYEVTQAQYKTIMGTTPSPALTKNGGNYPVEGVSWENAMEFCRRLTEREKANGRLPDGYEYTLPTEAQWEYAARGGHKSIGYHIYSGSDAIDNAAWYQINSGVRLVYSRWMPTMVDIQASGLSIHPVGMKQPNELGIYDMTGNVQEMCRDKCFSGGMLTETYKDGIINPYSQEGDFFIVRGGNSFMPEKACRTAFRSHTMSNDGGRNGFRVALAPVASPNELSSKNEGTSEEMPQAIEASTKGSDSPNEDVPKDKSQAIERFRRAAERGDAKAQYHLGLCYLGGLGIEKNITEAVKWFRKAAEQGNADAQVILGACCEKGDGVQKDIAKAVEWYRMAAEQGNADAQLKLGRSYERGEGVRKDITMAVKWYRMAAEQGNAKAQFTLSYILFTDNSLQKDVSEAVRWLREASEQGHAEAQLVRGAICEQAKDLSEAIKWYRKAAEQGNADAKKCLRELGY